MSRSQKVVNQQLAWCSTLIQQFDGNKAPWLEEVLLQSLTWHLQAGYCAFLQELATSQQLSVESSRSIVAVIRSMPSGKSCPAEFKEIEALELGESWLSLLLSKSISPTGCTATLHSSPSVDVIAVSGRGSWGLAEAKLTLSRLKALIERNRALNQEY